MTWCNTDQSTTTAATSQDETGVHSPFQIIPVHRDSSQENTSRLDDGGGDVVGTVTCPSCGHHIQIRAHEEQVRILQDLPGLPAGVKFDPTDQEILEHLEARVELDSGRLHPLIDEFIPTIEGENGICYTHPEKLPGVNKDGQIRHFFHRPSKAYTTGTRKRRKVHAAAAATNTTAEVEGGGSTTGETRWHKTGKTRPIFIGSTVKGFKKILVLYTNYGRQRKPEKTNWVMHQYHLGHNEEEKEGELVVSKVFFQTQPRQCGGSSSNVKEPEIPAPGKPISLVENISATSFTEFYNILVAASPPPTPLPLPFSYDLGGYGDGSSFIHLPSGASKGKSENMI